MNRLADAEQETAVGTEKGQASFPQNQYALIGAALVMVLLGTGCGKGGSGAKPPAEVEAKLAAIRQAGEPVTLTELDASYVEPPAGENAAPLYAEAFAALASEDGHSPSFVEKNQKALELLHRAAARTQCRFPTDLKAGANALLPHVPKIKPCAQLLAQDAALNAMKGRSDLATQSVLDCLRLARSLEAEPTIVSQLTRIAAEQVAAAALEQALSRRAFPPAELEKMQSAFEEAEKGSVGTFARAFVGERCTIIDLFQGPPRELSKALAAMGQSLPVSSVEAYRKSTTNQADFAFCLDQFRSLIAAAKLPFPECLAGASEWTAQISDARSKGYMVAPGMLLNLAKTLERAAARLSELREGQTAIAVERYRVAHGTALPVGLNALVPQYLAAVPADPFDGKPLRYKKLTPKGFVIYGVGPDRQDDGGLESKSGSAPEDKFDLVLTVRR